MDNNFHNVVIRKIFADSVAICESLKGTTMIDQTAHPKTTSADQTWLSALTHYT